MVGALATLIDVILDEVDDAMRFIAGKAALAEAKPADDRPAA
jgi:hypothetical protein